MHQVGPAVINNDLEHCQDYDEIPTLGASFRGMPRKHWKLESLCGFIYLSFTIGFSINFIFTMQRSTANDHYWPDLNVTGIQTYVADLYSSKLPFLPKNTSTSLDLNVTTSLFKDYSLSNTLIDINPSRAKSFLLGPISFESVIQNLRELSADDALRVVSPYCWVDFNRNFEMGITAKRQARCLAKDTTNAAVYLESVLNNIKPQLLIASNSYQFLNYSVLDALRRNTDTGLPWVNALLNRDLPPISSEVERWKKAGCTSWVSQISNQFQPGIIETVSVINALGLSKTITINNSPYGLMSGWTTKNAFYGYSSPSSICTIYLSCSLVRSAPNSVQAMGYDWDLYVVVGARISPVNTLVRRHIGPYGSIDLRYLPPPQALSNFFASFRDVYFAALQETNNIPVLKIYRDFVPLTLDPKPATWTNMTYYGGNPVCMFGPGKPYIQPSFSPNDYFGSQNTYSILLDKDSSVFAMSAMGSSSIATSVCTMSTTTDSTCSSTLRIAASIYSSLSFASLVTLQSKAWLEMTRINITLIQFATPTNNASAPIYLQQPMISSVSDPWSFLGWITLYEWVLGKREVFTFEGDIESVTTITPSQSFGKQAANPLQLPQTASNNVWYITVYVSAVLFSVGILMFLFGLSIRFHMMGRKLFQFNRVIGSVWIGRPFLLLRGMIAVIILSTANVQFLSQSGFSQFQVPRRPFLEVVLLAGETSWLTYTINDFFLPLTRQYSAIYAPLSSVVAWFIVVILEISNPYIPQSTVSTTCKLLRIDRLIQCDVGSIQVGSWQRLATISLIHLSCIVGAYAAVFVLSKMTHRNSISSYSTQHILIPAASQAFIADHSTEVLALDKVSMVMSGMIPILNHLFDVKLWGVMTSHKSTETTHVFRKPTFKSQPSAALSVANPLPLFKLRCLAMLGLGYIVLTLVGSYAYLVLTESTMANDFWWASFNTSGTQSYLSNWYNSYLLTAGSLGPIQIDSPQHGDSLNYYNSSTSNVMVSILYPSSIQEEAQTLANVVTGLRQMDGCLLPWIFTAYCYVDLKRVWEMAVTAEKQQRCTLSVSNGAVYLETFLRNAQWDSLKKCWGAALDIAILSELQSTQAGQSWILGVQSNTLSVPNEVSHWMNAGIQSYTTQWQNYKSVGIIETFSVRNAFGVSYPLTLKSSNGSFQIASQSSYKLYWGFANDLQAVSSNASTIGGKSLIRTSRNHVYLNTTIEAVYAAMGILPSPLGPEMALVRSILGPFGSIDVKRVPCPQSVRQVYRQLTESINNIIIQDNAAAMNYTALLAAPQFSPQPRQWSTGLQKGGNIFCEFGTQSGNQMLEFFTIQGLCGQLTTDVIYATRTTSIRAAIATNLMEKDAPSTNDICRFETRQLATCKTNLNQLREFLSKYPLPSFTTLTQSAKLEVSIDLNVTIAQFLKDGNTYSLPLVTLFDSNEPIYDFFSWLYIFEWVEGVREVIRVQGATSSFTALSGFTNTVQQIANAMEIPLNVAYYIRCTMQYMTVVLLLVGACVACIIIAVGGHVECWNMMEFNRVAGVVWIGRPLILLRGITAICLLSTARLELTLSTNNYLTVFTSPPRPMLTTFISCGEVTWFIYIINDILSPITKYEIIQVTVYKVFKDIEIYSDKILKEAIYCQLLRLVFIILINI